MHGLSPLPRQGYWSPETSPNHSVCLWQNTVAPNEQVLNHTAEITFLLVFTITLGSRNFLLQMRTWRLRQNDLPQMTQLLRSWAHPPWALCPALVFSAPGRLPGLVPRPSGSCLLSSLVLHSTYLPVWFARKWAKSSPPLPGLPFPWGKKGLTFSGSFGRTVCEIAPGQGDWSAVDQAAFLWAARLVPFRRWSSGPLYCNRTLP